MIRKALVLLLVLTGIIPFACCPEQPTGPYKFELSSLGVLKSSYIRPGTGYSDSHYIKPDETYTGDTLLLGLGLSYLMAHQSMPVSLHDSAMALSCDDYPGYTNLQDKITSVEVYSDQPFHEIPAGEPLTEKVSVYNNRSYRQERFITLQQAIINMNTLHFIEGMEMGLGSLVLPGKPDEPATRTFTVHIAYESGLEQTITSIPVRW